MNKILAIAAKELKTVFRETGGLFFMFLMPVALLIVFNMLFGGTWGSGGGDSPFRLPIVNLDKGEMGAQLVSELEKVNWVKVEQSFKDGTPYTAEDIERFVAEGKRNQALVIPENFSRAIESGQDVNMPYFIDNAIPIQYLGPVQGAITGTMFGLISRKTIRTSVQEKFGVSPEMFDSFMEEFDFNFSFDNSELPVKLQHTIPEQVDREEYPSVYQQNLAGYSVLSIFFIITAIGSSFVNEREGGTFRRILAAPVGRGSFLAGHLIPYVLINILQVLVLVLLSIFLYGTDLGGSPLALLLIVISTSIAANGLGLMMVTIFTDRTKLESISVVVVLITTALSGAFVPRFVMGEAVQQFSLIVPQSWAMEAFQDVLVRGGGVMDVLPNCGVIMLFAVGFFTFALLRFRFE